MGLKPRDYSQGTLSVPGPGQYNPLFATMKLHSPAFKIGTERRLPDDNTSVRYGPGPDRYNPNGRPISSAPNYGFGSSTRAKVKSTKDITPGPGAYKIPTKI